MINIISNVNPKIKTTLVFNNAIINTKTVCLTQKEAEDLYVDLLVKPSYTWLDLEAIEEIVDDYDSDVFDLDSEYEMYIDFDEDFIKYMNEKCPNKVYEETLYDEYSY